MENELPITPQQMKAYHVLFKEWADEFNEKGLTIQKVLEDEFEIQWNPGTVKELIFRPIIKAQFGKDSITELTINEVQETFDTINKHLGERLGIHVPFPSIIELMKQRENHGPSN